QLRALLLLPVPAEETREHGYDGPANLQIDVVPDRMGRWRLRLLLLFRLERVSERRRTLVGGAQVHAADDGNLVVGDQDFAVIALIQRQRSLERIDRVVLHELNAGIPQTGVERRRRAERSDRIVDHSDANSGAALRHQHVAELAAATLHVLQGVVLEIEEALRSL